MKFTAIIILALAATTDADGHPTGATTDAANPPPAAFKSCDSFTGTCPVGKHRAEDHEGCMDKDGQTADACTADHCCQVQCSSWTGTCPANSKKTDDTSCGSESSSCDATKCCEYNCKTSFVGTCTGDKVPMDQGITPADGKIDGMPAADYWKWNGDQKKDAGGTGTSCCQKTCKSSGRTCTAKDKDGKEMALKDNGKDRCMEGDEDKCSEQNFDGHCCEQKTCEHDKCDANGNWDDDCGKNAGCAAECNLSKESTKDELDKCAVCLQSLKKEWCGGCLQCLHDTHLNIDWKLKVEKKDNTLFSGATNTKLSSSFLTAAIASVTVAVTALAL